jgi:transcriptional regulator with XRE-family HTH domain
MDTGPAAVGTAPDSGGRRPMTELSAPRFGEQLRVRRGELGLTLRELARQVAVSPSLVSQVERGLAMPSVATIYALARVLELSLDDLFGMAPRDAGRRGAGNGRLLGAAVEHEADRSTIRLADGISWQRITAAHDGSVELLHSVYPPGSESCPRDAMIRHGGSEVGYVVAGRLTVTVGFDEHLLGPGDSVSYDSSVPHRLANEGDDEVRAVWLLLDDVRPGGATRPH